MDTARDARWDGVRKIWEIIDRLRGEPGCPWDRKQTPSSVQTYLVEEAHEAAAAIRAGDAREVAGELGDVLFMVLFLIHLYEEGSTFRLEDVCELINGKMIRRHPHVFGDVSVESAREVRDNWEKIKAEEKKGEAGGVTDSIPASLPALLRAYRIQSRLAQRSGEEGSVIEGTAHRFLQDSGTLARDLLQGVSMAPERFGEILFQVVSLARLQGLRSEDCLHEFLNGLSRRDREPD
ncbi:MAG: MazG family protein [Syntrophobacteraceae bacterium]|jgi:MazG family protein|nr:MazG family protein [Syntrophobacteraceae bacterium]